MLKVSDPVPASTVTIPLTVEWTSMVSSAPSVSKVIRSIGSVSEITVVCPWPQPAVLVATGCGVDGV